MCNSQTAARPPPSAGRPSHRRRGFGLIEPAPAQNTPPKPPPDVIVFTNGDQLTGTLERATGSSVVFKSDMAGEITVSLDKVKELHSSGSFAVLRKDIPLTRKSATVTPGTVAYGDGKLTIQRRRPQHRE